MNTDGLAKHYDKLSAWERLPLLLAAIDRGDDAEADRLARSAPRRPAEVVHHYGLHEGLVMLGVLHLLEQLQRAFTLVAAAAAPGAGQEHEGLLRMIAFRFVLDADAWKLFCAGLQIAPLAILRHLPGAAAVCLMEETARKAAFSPEEALAYLRRQWEAAEAAASKVPAARREYRLDTAAEVAREMREFLTELAQRWM